MDYREAYERWLCAPRAQGFHAELAAMDEAAVREAFSAELNFGTAGLRGIMGPGTNRMNGFTVAQTARAVADEIAARGAAALERGAVVAYDCRNGSRLFAAVTAAVLAR
ncbi:MAG: phospho-sugar mutase, partial [Oscillospiraceae bacterium]|nr:phospho-sugar mutase [Oscillospiraceae bacterium]